MNNYHKYLNVTKLEEDWGFFVTTTGFSKVDPNQNYPNEDHPTNHTLNWNKGRTLDGYYMVFITKGEGVFQSAHTPTTVVKEGTCFFLFPQEWHRYKPSIKSGWEEYWVGFKGEYADQLMSKGFFLKEHPFIQVGLNNDLLILFRKLLESARNSFVGYPQFIAGTTLQILGLVNSISIYREYDDDPIGKQIAKAKFLLRETLEQSIDMEKLASEIPMGYSSFRKSFKKVTGESPNQYLLNLRLARAKDLLTTTTLNINEVAYQTGFESVFYFSKLFKKKNDISPKTYRLDMKNNSL